MSAHGAPAAPGGAPRARRRRGPDTTERSPAPGVRGWSTGFSSNT